MGPSSLLKGTTRKRKGFITARRFSPGLDSLTNRNGSGPTRTSRRRKVFVNESLPASRNTRTTALKVATITTARSANLVMGRNLRRLNGAGRFHSCRRRNARPEPDFRHQPFVLPARIRSFEGEYGKHVVTDANT